MSSFLALIDFAGRSPQWATMQPAIDALAQYAPGDVQTYEQAPALLVQRASLTKATRTPPPTQSARVARDVAIVGDVRVDNRDDLARQLGQKPTSVDAISDLEWILLAYDRWGVDCVQHVLGVFAFVIWDADAQRVLCGRDALGIRPLYYHHITGEILACSNDLNALMLLPYVPLDLDTDEIAYRLNNAFGVSPQARTPFDAVRILEPAHTLQVTHERQQQTQYWSLAEQPTRHYASIDDYAEEFQHLLRSAVDVRLRTTGEVGAHLSGGLDSSAVTILAARRLREQNQSLTAFTWSDVPHIENLTERHEPTYIPQIAEREHITCLYTPTNSDDVLYGWFQDALTQTDTMVLTERATTRRAQSAGVRVMLSGFGGDQGISLRHVGWAADALLHGEFGYLAQGLGLRTYLQQAQLRTLARKLWKRIGLFLLPDMIYHPVMRRYYRAYKRPYMFLTSAYQRGRLPYKRDARLSRDLRRTIRAYHERGAVIDRVQAWYTLGRDHGMDYRYPLLDRRLLELAISLPRSFFHHPVYDRYQFRIGLTSIVPDQQQWTVSKVVNHVEEEDMSAHETAMPIAKARILDDPAWATPVPWFDIDLIHAYLRGDKRPEWRGRSLNIGKVFRYWAAWHAHLARQQTKQARLAPSER